MNCVKNVCLWVNNSSVCVCYLCVVGDRHGDAILIGDVVGAVIRGAWAWAGGAATRRVWNTNTNQTHRRRKNSSPQIKRCERRTAVCGSLTCHVERAFLGGGDGAVSTPQQRTAPPLAHLLLQPGAQLQVGLRGWKEGGERRTKHHESFIHAHMVWMKHWSTCQQKRGRRRKYKLQHNERISSQFWGLNKGNDQIYVIKLNEH